MHMTTQQKLDCLLKHFDMLAESQGDGVALVDQDIALLKKQCRFANKDEIGFYIRALDTEGFLDSDCSADNTILQGSITINGYRRLDTLRHP